MAYDRNGTIRMPLIETSWSRETSLTKDQHLINCYLDAIAEKGTPEHHIYVVKRPGYTPLFAGLSATTANNITFSQSLGHTYAKYGINLYRDNVGISAAMANGYTYYSEAVQGATTPMQLILDGSGGYFDSGTVLTKIVSANFPAATSGPMVGMDGYAFVINATNNSIQNSALGDFTTWNASNFISPNFYADPAVALFRYKNLIGCFGSYSTEFYYDAGNAVGSPLSRAQEYTLQVGCDFPKTIVNYNDGVIFVSHDIAGNLRVKYITKNFWVVEDISNSYVNRWINKAANSGDMNAWIYTSQGKSFYILQLTGISTPKTFAYDLDLEFWYEFSSQGTTSWNALYGCPTTGESVLQDTSALGTVMNTQGGPFYGDNGVAIPVTVQTNRWDFGTENRKFLDQVVLIGDFLSKPEYLQLSYSDDDYQSFSPPRSVDMSRRMNTNRWGSFRRRAWKIVHSTLSPFRMEAMEFSFDGGENVRAS